MSREILEQLFDSPIKVRLLKLFLRNPKQSYNLTEIGQRVRASSATCKKQAERLASIRLLSARNKGGQKFYSANEQFDFYNELGTLVLKSSPASKKKILRDVKKLGRISMLVLSGVFVDADNTRADLMLVGDGIRDKEMNTFIGNLEAEVGKEINYVVMTAENFKYRYEMFDRFIRDVLEKPHETLINKFSFVN